MNNHITNNTWIKYFLDTELIGYGWVDFEAEIDKVLNDIESFFSTLPNYVGTNIIASKRIDSSIMKSIKFFLPLVKDKYLCNYFGVIHNSDVYPSKLETEKLYLIEKLKIELEELIECLRIYFLNFVESINCNTFSEQVKSLGDVLGHTR